MLLADALIQSVSSEFARAFIHWFFEILISVLAVFLILLVLVQRGRGGGIAGALGGMGGNSAFGTKAGDTFTWITYGTAAVWILLAMLTIKTFTDPVQDKARRIAQQEEQEEEPLSPLDVGNPGAGDSKADDEQRPDEKSGDKKSEAPSEQNQTPDSPDAAKSPPADAEPAPPAAGGDVDGEKQPDKSDESQSKGSESAPVEDSK